MSSDAPLEANIVLSSSASTPTHVPSNQLTSPEIERISKVFIRLITAKEIGTLAEPTTNRTTNKRKPSNLRANRSNPRSREKQPPSTHDC